MRLDTFMLADGVSTPPDGKIYIHGGGITRINVPQVPFTIPISVLIRIQAEPNEALAAHTFELAWRDPQDALLIPTLSFTGQSTDELPPDSGEELYLSVALNVGGLPFTTYGLHRVELSVDGESLRVLQFPVVQLPVETPIAVPEVPVNRAERRRQEREARKRT